MNQRWLAIIIGVLAIYLLIHAGMAGYGAFLIWDLDKGSPQVPLPDELGEAYAGLVVALVIFGVFGLLSIASSVGVGLGRNWARRVWVGTSIALVTCAMAGTILWTASWTQYFYEVAVVFASWWMMAVIAKEKREV
jgi:hypothetical protein